MEESEKRRERLKAMRVEAAKADVSVELESSGMVSHKRRNNFSHQASQGYSMPPNMTSSLGQRPTQATENHLSQGSSLGTSMGAADPLGNPQGNASNTWGGSYSSLNYNYPPNMQALNFPDSNVGQGYSPHPGHSWGGGGRYNNSPHPQLHSHQSPNMLDVEVPNSGIDLYSPHGIHGWGRGGRYSNSLRPCPQLPSHHDPRYGIGHYPDWGRGRGQSLGSRPSARRGKNSGDPVPAELRPDLYYHKDMLEDPWKGMTPVIWKGQNSDGSWLPKSISMKKVRPSPEASQKSVSQLSLAEYLATLSGTVNEPTHEEHEQSEFKLDLA